MHSRPSARSKQALQNVMRVLRRTVLGSVLVLGAHYAILQTGVAQNSPADHYQRGVSLLEQRLWVPAISEFQEALKLDPNQVATHIALGIAFSNNNEQDRALDSFRKAVELGPRSAEARFNLGLALRNAGQVEEAITELTEAVSIRAFA